MTNALRAHRRHFGLAEGFGLLGEAVGRQIQTVMVAVGEVAAAAVAAVPTEVPSSATPTGSENG